MNNRITAAALRAAASAVEILDAQGITVTGYRSDARKPVLTVARKPGFTRGAIKRRSAYPAGDHNIIVERVLAAPFHGCQLEWREVEAAPREVRHG